MRKVEAMFRVGHNVRHKETGKVGRIVALSHARDEYLVLWADRSQSRHSRWALVTEVGKV